MAEIIDLRPWLRNSGAAAGGGEGVCLRVRICGPDLHWLGVVGGILAGALLAESVSTAFADVAGSTAAAPVFDLVAGAPAAVPGLLIAGGAPLPTALDDCARQTVLLLWRSEEAAPAVFPGLQIMLPLSDPAPASLTLAAGCAGGAGRLLGFAWSSIEPALRQELHLSEPIEPCLIAAFESYHRLAPWAGAVTKAVERYN